VKPLDDPAVRPEELFRLVAGREGEGALTTHDPPDAASDHIIRRFGVDGLTGLRIDGTETEEAVAQVGLQQQGARMAAGHGVLSLLKGQKEPLQGVARHCHAALEAAVGFDGLGRDTVRLEEEHAQEKASEYCRGAEGV
jgi:hypothetical protein